MYVVLLKIFRLEITNEVITSLYTAIKKKHAIDFVIRFKTLRTTKIRIP